jgi:hypothetical protein
MKTQHFGLTFLLAGTALITASPAFAVPSYDHIVVVVEENHDLAQVVDNPNAPATFINNTLLPEGTLLTNSHGTEHSSEPNYNELFSGNPQGVGSVFANGGGASQTPNAIPGITIPPHAPQGGSTAVQTDSTSPVLNLTNAAGTTAVLNKGTVVPLTGNDNTIPGTNGDQIPLNTPNLGAALIRSGKSFAGYTEGLPSNGDRTDINGSLGAPGSGAQFPLPPSAVNTTTTNFQRKHQTWINWQATSDNPSNPNLAKVGAPLTANQLSSSTNLSFNAFPGQPGNPFANPNSPDFTGLPSVSFVTPDAVDDEHDQTPANGSNINLTADQWLQKNIASYAQWAITHNSLLIVTWDEDSGDFYVLRNGKLIIVNVSTFNPKTDVLANANGVPLPVDSNGNPLSIDFANDIPTILVGADVAQGATDNEFVDHCGILRTIEEAEGLGTLTNDPSQTCDVNAAALSQAFVSEPPAYTLFAGLPVLALLRRRVGSATASA